MGHTRWGRGDRRATSVSFHSLAIVQVTTCQQEHFGFVRLCIWWVLIEVPIPFIVHYGNRQISLNLSSRPSPETDNTELGTSLMFSRQGDAGKHALSYFWFYHRVSSQLDGFGRTPKERDLRGVLVNCVKLHPTSFHTKSEALQLRGPSNPNLLKL